MSTITLTLMVAYAAASVVLSSLATWAAIRVARAGRTGFAPIVMWMFGLHMLCMLVLALCIIVGSLELFVGVSLAISLISAPIVVRALTKARWGRTFRAALLALLFGGAMSLGAAVLLRAFVVQAFQIASQAMSPTMEPRERVIVERLAQPARWDVVVFRSPEEHEQYWVFRVVGLPGESVELKQGALLINGAPVAIPSFVPVREYRVRAGAGGGGEGNGREGAPLKLGADEYYVLGDNTEYANDSRYWKALPSWGRQAGALPRSKIVGVVRLRCLSAGGFGVVR